jgi:hypothetical protein
MTLESRPSYALDTSGRLVLVGLTFGETEEFEKLDASLPYDAKTVWPDEGLPLLPMEARWLQLWMKHVAATSTKKSG